MIRITLMLAAMVVVGCATTYQKISDSTGGGFDDVRLDSNLYQVSFSGNGYTDSRSVSDMALLRCSQLALSRGYTYFVVFDNSTDNSFSTYYLPTSTATTTTAAIYGNTITANSYSTTTGGPISVSRSTSSIVFAGFKTRPDTDRPIFGSQMVCESLATKYGTHCFTSERAEVIHTNKKQKDAEGSAAASVILIVLACTVALIAASND